MFVCCQIYKLLSFKRTFNRQTTLFYYYHMYIATNSKLFFKITIVKIFIIYIHVQNLLKAEEDKTRSRKIEQTTKSSTYINISKIYIQNSTLKNHLIFTQ